MKWIFAIAAILAVTAVVAAKQSSAPPPQPIVVQQKSPLVIQYDRGTEDKPLVVHNQLTDEENSAEEAKATDDHELTVSTKALTHGTWLLGGASIAAAILAAISSAIAARAATDIRKIKRGYVFARVESKNFEDEQPDGSRTFRAVIKFHNHGQTPAFIRMLRAMAVTQDLMPTELPNNPKATREMPEGLVVGAGTDWSWDVTERITKDQYDAIYNNNIRTWVMGLMRYRDLLGEHHETHFCWYSENQRRNGMVFLIAPTDVLNNFK